MSLSRSSSKYSRHERLTNSQLFELKKTNTPKLFQLNKQIKVEQPFFMASQSKLTTNEILKSKIKEKKLQQETVELKQLVTKIDPIRTKKISIDTAAPALRFKPYSLTPQSRLQIRISSPSLKPRSQSQAKREAYYLNKVQVAFDTNACDYFSRIYREHFHQTYQGLNHKFQPQNNNDFNRVFKLFKKPEHKNKITLFFDLDETLVHCNESPSLPHDLLLDITISKFQNVKAGINIRPYAKELIKNLSDHFELIIFTASHSCYAEKVLFSNFNQIMVINHIDPDNLISHRLYREHCTMTSNQLYTKDLKIFCDQHNRPISQVAIIDNASYSYTWNIENGIPIVPFYDNKDDKELQDLEKYLMSMIGQVDVREYNRLNLKLPLIIEPKGPYRALENLFGKS